MSKKTSGLGRGLGDLLEDNAPELKSATVIRRDEDGEVRVSPVAVSYVREAESEKESKPLVFPKVTPISGGASDSAEKVSEEIEKNAETSEGISEKTAEPEPSVSENEEKPLYEELPRTRSLKAIFRTFNK